MRRRPRHSGTRLSNGKLAYTMTSRQGEVLLIVPAYNEAANIERVVNSIRSAGYDYLIVNDGSKDDTESILRRINANHVQLVHNLGIGGAVQTGYIYALRHGYKVAVQFDGDGQHDINSVESVVKPVLDRKADITLGSRFIGDKSDFKSSAARRAGIRLLSQTILFATGVRLYDVTSGFRAAGVRAIKLFADNYPSDYPEPESLTYALADGLTVLEVPVAMHERIGGSSSIGGLSAVWYMLKVGLSVLLRGSYIHRSYK